MTWWKPFAAVDTQTRYDAARDAAILAGIDAATECDTWDRFTEQVNGSPARPKRSASVSGYGLSGGLNGSLAYPKIISGKLTYDGPGTGVSAGYAELPVPGDRMRRIGGKFSFGAGTTTGGSAVLIGWANSIVASYPVIPNSPCHLAITTTGWQYLVWQNNASISIGAGTFTTPLAQDGTVYNAEVFIDQDASKAYVFLPDGTIAVVTHALIASVAATYACWEMYRNVNTDPITAFTSTWADSGGDYGVARTTRGVNNQGKILAVSYAPASQDTVVPTAEADIDATNLALTFIAPPSGKVLVEMTGYLVMTGVGQVLWGVRQGSTSYGLQTVVNEQANRLVTSRKVYAVTPGISYTLKWSHFCVQANVATFKMNSSSGYAPTFTVTPLSP